MIIQLSPSQTFSNRRPKKIRNYSFCILNQQINLHHFQTNEINPNINQSQP
ncbi:hypothetical protein HanXRQr2_Chr14g0647051 [Helianthus annuus]|uniref:Uncharacterized protein n=1 Tax=Helianthus annuus TaxID=4232 RepID=A0A9K3E9B7_HELAN|nr:hypothetical protein HanXRQr2_Chr14g0647051 [Helianthus annuus]KAJ0840615.1 hypothetical protein HanPSC8_Chr14g0620781 [Helianthus annuus]